MGQTDLRTFDLPSACFVAQVRADLVDIGDPRRAEWVTLGEQATWNIDGNSAAQGNFAFINQPAGFAVLANAEILIVQNLVLVNLN